jgi:class 3 adenylate cyclase
MRRSLTSTIVLTLAGFLFGVLFRHRFDPAEEATYVNYLRSGLHGAGVTYAAWTVHVYFTSRSSEWLRRWPLAAELLIRALVMAAVITTVTTVLQVLLYDLRLEAKWLVSDLPKIVTVALILSILIAAVHELTRLIGGRALFSVMIGRYRRPIREERVLLFLDLAGSTTLAENMGEVRVQDLLKEFFFDIDQPISAHGGEVHAYVGDEVIVTWRVTPTLPQRRCVDCFFAIEDRIAARAEKYRKEFGLVPEFRAGLHAGWVVVSECGDSRRQVAYFGDAMNVTARLQALCKDAGRTLLVSGDLLRLVEPIEDLIVEPLGPTRLRGRAAPIEVFSVERLRLEESA